ncbi:hypothetical protein FRC06_004472 [Ceratobasidium sp. 370]|nr:hypothetical protein FRC06_004472 [Ceratobasidium sp. 370]
MSLKDALAVSKNLDDIEKKMDSLLLKDIDLMADAVSHVVQCLRPSNRATRSISSRLSQHVAIYKARFDNAVEEYNANREFEHYYDYILDVAYDINYDMLDDMVVEILQRHDNVLQAAIEELQKTKCIATKKCRNARLRELAKQHGLRSVGHLDPDRSPFNVRCVDAFTHQTLDIRKMLVNGVDNDDVDAKPVPQPLADATANAARQSNERDPSAPPPAMDLNTLPADGFVTREMLEHANFKKYSFGTVYGFAPAENGVYCMVWAVQFSPIGSFSPVEQEAIDVFVSYTEKVRHHAHEVKNNRAQNDGRIFGTGWRPGRTAGEKAGEYAPQSAHDKHNPDDYIRMHEEQEAVSIAWMIMQERLSPRAVMTNVETLADTAVPLFGYHDSDISTHGPSLGSNMSVSMQDAQGRNFANSMHVDHDVDSLPQYYGKVFTFGQWLHTNDEGKLVEGEELRAAIPDGYFVLPGYRVAFDLGGAAVVTAIWRGGMDLHGTTTSTVDMKSGITRWGMSIQTNKRMPKRMRSGKGAIFGAFDKLRAYYDALFLSDDVQAA